VELPDQLTVVKIELDLTDLLFDLPAHSHGVVAETLEVVDPLVIGVEHHVEITAGAGAANVVEFGGVRVDLDVGVGGHKRKLISARLAGAGGIHGNSSYRLDTGYSGSEGGHTQCRPHCK